MAKAKTTGARKTSELRFGKTEKQFLETPFGHVVKQLELPMAPKPRGPIGQQVLVDYIDPPAYFFWLARERPELFRILAETSASCGGKFSLVIYNDGATCGNMMDVDAAKKLEVFTYSFEQLGEERLCCVDWRFWLCAVRETQVKTVDGGLSTVFAALLKVLVGQRFTIQAITFEFSVRHFVMDEMAEQACWGFKGHAALKPCWECANVTSWQWQRAEFDETRQLVHIGCSDHREFVTHTDAAIYGIVEHLRTAANRSKTQLREAEKRYGFLWLPRGPLADLQLRSHFSVTNALRRDPAHVLLLGIMPMEIYRLATKMEAIRNQIMKCCL